MRVYDLVPFYRGAIVEDSKLETPILSEVNRNKLWGCLDRLMEFKLDNRNYKLMRWVGFIQGVFWVTGFYDLHELKHHNKGMSHDLETR